MNQKGLLAIIDVQELSEYYLRGLLAILMYTASIMIWWDNRLLLRNNMTMRQRY